MLRMSKYVLPVLLGVSILVLVLLSLHLIYFPSDILNLFPLFHSKNSSIPHNTLVSDPVFQFEPWRYFVKNELAQGQFPLWNGLNAGGVPLFANAQSSVLFPLNFIYYLLPISVSLNLIVLLKVMLLFFFTFIFLRSLKVSKAACALGSFATITAGFPTVWLLWPHTNVFFFLPLFLYLTEKISQGGKTVKRWYILLSVSYFIAILGGHYETLLHVMLLHIPYSFYRFKFSMRKILSLILFVFFGILMASVQLIPFLEYFLASSAFADRVHSPYLYLPLQSFLLTLLPFFSGAPHLAFYRPIVSVTNFQESMGGYTGIIVLITAVIGSRLLVRKRHNLSFWLVSAIIFWLLAFKIWPIGILLEMPLISQVQNSRLSAIAAFSTIVLFTYTIDSISSFTSNKGKIFPFIFGFVSLVLLVGALSIEILTITTRISIFKHPFIPYLVFHIVSIAFTTLLFSFIFYFRRKKKLFILLSAILIGLQTACILFGYIPFLRSSQYYPKPNVLVKIQGLPKGTLLEVGNPSLPPDTNLIYGIPHAQNYDGIEVNSYKKAFDKAFPDINQWHKVENFSLENLQKFNISYVLSDFDINNTLQSVQTNYSSLIGPIVPSKLVEIVFRPKHSELREIRLLPANYNRKNSCNVRISINENESKKEVIKKMISCKDILDKMYLTVDVGGVTLDTKKSYLLGISSDDASTSNSIGLWGNKSKPFVELYFTPQEKRVYQLLAAENNVRLYKVPGVNEVVLDGNYKVTVDSSSKFSFDYYSPNPTKAEIKKIFYPGWKVYVDAEKVEVKNKNPYIAVTLPAGKHKVVMLYDPQSFKFGIIVSLLTLFILIVILKVRN